MRKRPLANLLYHIGKLENLLINQKLASINLRMSHAHVLRYIQKHPGCIQKEVADYLFYQPASFTNVVKLLEKRNMIGRRPDPTNGLKKQLFLLPAGKEVLDQVNDAFDDVNKLVGTVDSEALLKLERISTNLEKQI
ncbi:MarR family winged helix-turn-helix transcriptional regulator [Lactobacillus taiwanensis]|uniref:MarR family winged helix-turn-helix transcriptional regulator n=2 Tax=Lactobacillus taiwanensis TaxID=508451 RepID=UPI000B987A43|nr:MarR family transcriptional regulator [Lactobacillus taiwanensis]OYR95014.1 MarR family transcriptional regulator [Lactobacillus taiwanensis]OYS02853.1 MarR family transcriptional regulator [Lactobacillus taiwanensis]OYS12444.1 MarR family transcriptional regulator [Lactobacillus taiwanensis]OYS16873.1 MarR family transcriptional regulator [Lactobacillus taiwanensis]OYS17723.1 MarR family transcriptional regulator [Lactobacillus taiwanensis]